MRLMLARAMMLTFYDVVDDGVGDAGDGDARAYVDAWC